MATIATAAASEPRRARAFAPDRFERLLATGAIVLLAAVVAALARGHAQWGLVPAAIWAHLVTILVALALTPTMLLRPRGDRLHRRLGRVWASAMLLTAALSFLVQTSHSGHYSLIHLLSLFTLVQVPVILWSARTHRVALHRRAVRGMVLGALLIAGFFTFPFDRMLGSWLFA